MANKIPEVNPDLVDVDDSRKPRGRPIGPHARASAGRARLRGAATSLRKDQREEKVMRLANAVRSAAVLTVGLIVSGCAVRVRPAEVVVDPIPVPEVVIERPVVDVHVSRPVIVERKTVVVEQRRPVVIERKTTVVENNTTVRHDNGNHYGQDKDKFSNPAARGDNAKHDDKD